MHSAIEDLELDGLHVIHAREATFPLTERIRALSLGALLDALEPLR